MSLREWMDRAVANMIADEHPEGAAPWSAEASDLFAQVASLAHLRSSVGDGRSYMSMYSLNATSGITLNRRRQKSPKVTHLMPHILRRYG